MKLQLTISKPPAAVMYYQRQECDSRQGQHSWWMFTSGKLTADPRDTSSAITQIVESGLTHDITVAFETADTDGTADSRLRFRCTSQSADAALYPYLDIDVVTSRADFSALAAILKSMETATLFLETTADESSLSNWYQNVTGGTDSDLIIPISYLKLVLC